MAILFLVLIILFAISASYYLVKNDFNSKTIEVIFPAVGAIILSLYLGFKSIWIDAPKPSENRTNFVLIQDVKEGKLHSLIMNMALEPPELYFKFRGLKKIMVYRGAPEFKELPFWEDLKGGSIENSDDLVVNILEYSILDWLSQEYVTVGRINKGSIIRLKGASQNYGVHEGLVPLVPISAKKQSEEQNPFLKARDISIKLPVGSKITRERLDGPFFRILIETPNSKVEFRVLSKSGGALTVSSKLHTPGDELALKIKNLLRMRDDIEGFQMFGMPIEIITTLKKFSRYSNQAEIETEWHKNLVEQFDDDYSWDKLRTHYEAMS